MTESPKISILIPTYLRLEALTKKIDELKKLSENYNLESIFVLEIEDNESYELIEHSGLNKYKICYNYSKFGHFCFPTALKYASGNYIIHMGDDDYFEKEALKHIYNAINNYPEANWLIGKGSYIDEKENKIRKTLTEVKYYLLKKFSFNFLSIANFVMTPSVIIKKDFLKSIGGFDTNYKHANDYYCWLKAAKKSKPIIITKNLSNVSFSTSTASGSFDLSRYAVYLKKILQEQENKLINFLQILSTFYLVSHNIIFKKIFNVYKLKINLDFFNKELEKSKNLNQIKILHLTRFFDIKNLGGMEEGIIQLNYNAKKFNVKNDILCTSTKNALFKYENMNVIQCKESFTLASNVFSLEFYKIFKKIFFKYDFIHIHYPYPFADFTVFLNRKNLKSKIILTYHLDIVRQKLLKKFYLYFFKNFFSKYISLVNVSSELYYNTSEIKKSISSDKNFFIQKLGLKDISEYNYNLEQLNNEPLRKFFEVHEKVSFFMARDKHYKGFDRLKYLLENNLDKPFVVCTSKSKIKKYCEGKKNIFYIEFANNIEKFFIMKNSYINLFTSDNKAESFGIILMECQMFGVPSIVFNLQTGVNIIIKDGYNGLVANLNNNEEFNNIYKKIYNDVPLREKLSLNSRLNYEKNYNLNNFENYYKFLLSNFIKH